MSSKSSSRLDPVFGPGKGAGDDQPPAYPPLTMGRFLVEREVGRGHLSVVYRATDPRDGRTVALKVLYGGKDGYEKPALLTMVEHECETNQLLSHPHIVRAREWGEVEDHAFIAFPFVQGIPLAQALSADTLDVVAGMKLMQKVALALHHAHGRGLIHRDLKPGNILVGSDREPHVLDFGLSWRTGGKSESGVQSIVGTPAYMSPEQARGEEDRLTPATDVYSLGAVMYEICTGRPPFAGGSKWKTMQMVMGTEPAQPREINSQLDLGRERVVLWCLEKNPAKRYQSCEELSEDIARACDGEQPRGPRAKGFFRRFFTN